MIGAKHAKAMKIRLGRLNRMIRLGPRMIWKARRKLIEKYSRFDSALRRGRRKITRAGIEPFLRRELAEVNGQILDLGGGAGTYSTLLPPTAIHLDIKALTGVDVVADAHRLPFPEECFDCVLCTEVIQFLVAPADAVAEIGRILRRGGKAVLTIRFIFPIHERPTDLYRFTRYGIQTLFSDFDTTVVEQHSAYMTALAAYVALIADTRVREKSLLAAVILATALALAPLDALFGRLVPDDFITSGYLVVARKRL